MAKDSSKPNAHPKVVEATKHYDASRKNIPSAEHESVMEKELQNPIRVAYERGNRDLDPQLVWRGKDMQDWSDLVVHAPPIYIQEKVHPKVLIEDLINRSKVEPGVEEQPDLFGDFNGIPEGADKTEFYQHDGKWQNRMILGDSLQVMASLAEREGLRGKVQCIYFDPPYGIKFNSNFQWSTTSRDVKDGKAGHITREPEQVKAFRDTWRDGIHSYLTYLRDRLTVARDLLTESGSIFVQIGDENVHRVRAVLDEVFGDQNFISLVSVQTTTGFDTKFIGNMSDFILWYAKCKDSAKVRVPYVKKQLEIGEGNAKWIMFPNFLTRGVSAREKSGEVEIPLDVRLYKPDNILSQGGSSEPQPVTYCGRTYDSYGKNSNWKANYPDGMYRLVKAGRIHQAANSIQYVRFYDDFAATRIGNIWTDTGTGNFTDDKVYVVQTNTKVISRCILMASDPGDLVLDPTCGSGTTATVAEQWGRRWITIDTSRVALALARVRIMGARYPFYLLADSREGQAKEASLQGIAPSTKEIFGNIRHGFVYDRLPQVTLGSIANNVEIDVIWEKWQHELESLRHALNAQLSEKWEEWEIPREAGIPWIPQATSVWHKINGLCEDSNPANEPLIQDALTKLNLLLKRDYTLHDFPDRPYDPWADEAMEIHAQWWKYRIERQYEIDQSIAEKAESKFLYDKPFEDKKKVRVAGPFTVESLSPHRVMAVDENDDIFDVGAPKKDKSESQERDGFVEMILENLRTSGVQQPNKQDKIAFTSLTPWPGYYICAEARYQEGDIQRRAGIFIGPEFGTVARGDLVGAAREAGDADFDVVISCAFNYDAHSSEFDKLGRIPILKARMNADLHMSDDLKNTGKGNLFVIFGEPDIDILPNGEELKVKINGVDVFDPRSGEVRSDGADGIACWFIDTDYNGESFFVRHAYFLGANDPYKSLKTTLKAEINEEAWSTLNSDISRSFEKPSSGKIAVKVINHLGDEVMKVFKV
jgi:adenine-specific DNA-methyltransferase